MNRFRRALFALAVILPTAAFAQTMPGMSGTTQDATDMVQMHAKMMVQMHAKMMAQGSVAGTEVTDTLKQGGEAAFAAIQEIVTQLAADPTTDWSKVNIEALRQHLIDMDNVTIRASVAATSLPKGARFAVSSEDPGVRASIQRMVLAHAKTMNGANGWTLLAKTTDNGAELTVTGAPKDAAMIQGLGFIGVMTLGTHHQAHHLMLAQGMNPHQP